MLSRKRRLNRADFHKTIKKSKKIEGVFVSVRISYVGKEEESRFSAVISSKVAPKASQRNLLKRRIYEAVRGVRRKGNRVIFYAKKEAAKTNFMALNKDIHDTLGRA